MQNSVINTWNTCLYVCQPSSVVFACKTAHFGPELQVSMGPSPHLWFWSRKTACLEQESKDYIGSSSRRWFCACKTATLRLELQYLWVKVHPCCFCMQNCDFWTRITSLYGSQTWPVVLCMYNSMVNIRITSLYRSQPSSVVFACKTAWLASEKLVSMGPYPHDWFLDSKQRLLDRINMSLWVPNITCSFVPANQRD